MFEEKVIFATANHRWFRKPRRSGDERNTSAKIECTTLELSNMDKLVSTFMMFGRAPTIVYIPLILFHYLLSFHRLSLL